MAMNGAEILVQTLLANGIDTCFANPGTSEMHFVAALDRNKAMRCVLGLFEGVVTGAADGYYRMLERPAATLLHLGPGLGNGIANLHNAKKAQSGILNIVGEHVTTHLRFNPPLAADIEGLARPVSAWVRTATDAGSIAPLTVAAIAAIAGPPPTIATLILPGDAAWGLAGSKAVTPQPAAQPRKRVGSDVIDKAARLLRSGEPTLVILGGPALKGPALDHAGEIAGKTACPIATQFFSARLERGAGRVPLERIPYAVDQALTMLKPFRHIITVCTDEPIAFFAYPGKPSLLKPDDCDVLELCSMQDDCTQALADLAGAVGAKDADRSVQPMAEKPRPSGALNPENLAQALLATMPEGCILVDESVTTGRESFGVTAGAAPHDNLQNMGGSIGFGTPVSTGAAIACPDRPVLCIVGDGSAMYTIQSLWTQVREGLNVTTIVCANRSYQILKNEFKAVGAGVPGSNALSMLDIDNPTLDFVSLAKGMGMSATKVARAEDLCRAIERGLAAQGPCLLEAQLSI
jgi:acetolactate synthase I/II/III large subunit